MPSPLPSPSLPPLRFCLRRRCQVRPLASWPCPLTHSLTRTAFLLPSPQAASAWAFCFLTLPSQHMLAHAPAAVPYPCPFPSPSTQAAPGQAFCFLPLPLPRRLPQVRPFASCPFPPRRACLCTSTPSSSCPPTAVMCGMALTWQARAHRGRPGTCCCSNRWDRLGLALPQTCASAGFAVRTVGHQSFEQCLKGEP